ncbi:MAG: thioredoxin family protein [Acidobacteria bacterium]|nr:thioredoxin family protein [Acidobacteriota bacterium]
MVCPNCNQFTPDQNYKCIHCGAVTAKKEQFFDPDKVSPLRQDAPSAVRPWMVAILGLLALLGYLAYTRLNRSHAVNAFQPGAELAITAHLQKGKVNIVDFYSDYCPPCKKISPLLVKLGKKRPDLAVIQVDINRKGVQGIDWASPLARQYNLSSIPHFQIYDGDGNLAKEGQEAYVQIILMLAQSGIKL